jgi:hypothetical protein
VIRPSKHAHPDRTVIYVAILVITRLKGLRVEEYSVLKEYVKKHIKGGEVLFLPALNLLYLLGLIEYRPKTDAIEYVRSNEAL